MSVEISRKMYDAIMVKTISTFAQLTVTKSSILNKNSNKNSVVDPNITAPVMKQAVSTEPALFSLTNVQTKAISSKICKYS